VREAITPEDQSRAIGEFVQSARAL